MTLTRYRNWKADFRIMMINCVFFILLLSSPSQAYLSTRCRRHSTAQRIFSYPENDSLKESFTQQRVDNVPDPIMSRCAFFTSAAFASLAFPTAVACAANDSPVEKATAVTTHSYARTPFHPELQSKSPSLTISASESTSIQESISGFVAGGALAATKTLVKYPLDTVTVRLQVPSSQYAITDLGALFRGSYNGVTLSLLSNIPGGAVFFAIKDVTKASLKASVWASSTPKWVTTTLAVGAALIPYWIVRNPSEVIKVRQQAGIPGYGDGVSAVDAVKFTFDETVANGGSTLDGLRAFYTGYWENVIYGLPADVIKFVAYEAFTGGRRDLSPLEGACAGALATGSAQLLTTPLDVVRNRLMTGTDSIDESTSRSVDDEPSTSYIDALIKLGEEEGLSGLFAGSSPRVAKAFLSGAIQFATYEETKQSISRLLQR